MPARDICEPQFVTALEKAGWVVTNQPYTIGLNRVEYAYADLRLRHFKDFRSIIVVEVKCFATATTYTDDFYHAIGQYHTYRAILRLKGVDESLYLAVPLHFYEEIKQRIVMQSVITDAKISIIVVDLDDEEIVSWIP